MDKVTKAHLEAMNRAAAANAWLAQGYFPMPVTPGQKATRYKHAPWLEKLTDRSVDVHWSTYPTDDIALHCGQGLVVLDADSRQSLDAMLMLEAKHGLHPQMVVNTQKGVHHYFRQAPDLRIKAAGYSTTEHPERIDVRCRSAYIITAPSTGKTLATEEVVRFEDLTLLTQAFVDELFVHNGDRPLTERPEREAMDGCGEFGEPVDVSVKVARMRALLEHIDPDEGYSSWIQVLMAIHHETGGSDEGMALADEWSSKGGSYDGFRSIEQKWASFNAGSSTPVTMASLVAMVRDQGLDPWTLCAEADEPFEACEMEVLAPVKRSRAVVRRTTSDMVQPISRDRFPHQPSRKNAGVPATFENFVHLMRAYGVQVSYDMVRKDVLIKVPHLVTTVDNAKEVTNAHIKSLCAMNDIPVTHIGSNILALADLNAFNPVADWIVSKPWDGGDRLPAFRATLVTDDDYPVNFRDTLLDRWMTSAVAAMFDDDFKSRGVLTLSGPQGIGKTSWVNALVSCPELRKATVLTGHSLDANSRDSKSTALTKWITELGEVEATLKHDLPAFKAFITNDIDVFRRPYAASDSTMPRRTVFCASVNDKWYLKDPTGNSRFWSIKVAKVNYEHGLDMQQVFAQYKAQFFDKVDAKWWLDPEQEKFLTELNKEFEPISPVQEALTLLINQGREKKHDLVFMTSVQLIKLIDMRATSKEVHAVMRDLVGPPRKTGGLYGWDLPLIMSLD